jgi:hypothetical protein
MLSSVSDLHASSSSLSSTASSPPASPHLSSSAGPLKKRRKMELQQQQSRCPTDQTSVSTPTASIEDINVTSNNRYNEFHPFVDNEISEICTHSGFCSQLSPHPHNHPLVNAHFPTILHRLLTLDTSDNGCIVSSSAIEWLPHGKGWRVLRWEVLCKDVLPRLFHTATSNSRHKIDINSDDNENKNNQNHNKNNNCKNDNNNACYQQIGQQPLINSNDIEDMKIISSSASAAHDNYDNEEWLVEVFLWHVRAFGFAEVTSGIDRGSYCHEVRIKEKCLICCISHCKATNYSSLSHDTMSSSLAALPSVIPSPIPSCSLGRILLYAIQ